MFRAHALSHNLHTILWIELCLCVDVRCLVFQSFVPNDLQLGGDYDYDSSLSLSCMCMFLTTRHVHIQTLHSFILCETSSYHKNSSLILHRRYNFSVFVDSIDRYYVDLFKFFCFVLFNHIISLIVSTISPLSLSLLNVFIRFKQTYDIMTKIQ